MGEMTITRHAVLDDDLTEPCYAMYRDAFEPMRTRAAARHLLSADEFADEMADHRIDKYVARHDDALVGLLTLTTDLAAVPWIEPQFYYHRWPDKAARNGLFYLGFVLTDPTSFRGKVATKLTDTTFQRVVDADGTLCWDAARFNVERGIGRLHHRIENHWGTPVEVVDDNRYFAVDFSTDPPQRLEVDTQTYYVAHFSSDRTPATV